MAGVERSLAVVATVLLVVATAWVYRDVISPLGAYTGLTYGFEWSSSALVCLMFALLPLAWLPIDISRPSQMVLWFLYVMVVLPCGVVPVLTGKFDDAILLRVAATITSAFGLLCAIASLPAIRVPRIQLSDRQYDEVVLVVFGALFMGCVGLFGIPSRIPTLADIYGLRELIGQEFAEYGRLAGYVVQWFGKALTIVLFVRGVSRRRAWMVAVALMGQLYIFALLAEKALFFSLFFVGIVYLLVRGERNRFGLKILGGTLAVVAVGLIEVIWFGSELVLWMSLRRLLVTPGINTAYFFEYYTYFSEKVYYAYNVIGRILPIDAPYGYDYSPSRMVGMTYVTYAENFVINLNVNLWGEGYADFGTAGVFIATMILGVVLWTYDSVSRPVPLRISTSILAVSVVGLVDGSLYTQLMTNGLLLLLVLVYLQPRRQKSGALGSRKETT